MSAEAKEAWDGLVKDLTDSCVKRMFTAGKDLNTFKPRHVVITFAQEVVARQNGKTNLLPTIVKASQEVQDRFQALYATTKKE